jgi:uncharacterized repeat protein (TIGR04042 family)
MPEMRFVVRWPDGVKDTCYSPSLVIKDYFREGETYALADFVARSREALTIASDRVKAKYGHAGSVRNFVRGAIIAPMEGEYGDQEGHAGRSFGGPRPEGCVFEGRSFR